MARTRYFHFRHFQLERRAPMNAPSLLTWCQWLATNTLTRAPDQRPAVPCSICGGSLDPCARYVLEFPRCGHVFHQTCLVRMPPSRDAPQIGCVLCRYTASRSKQRRVRLARHTYKRFSRT